MLRYLDRHLVVAFLDPKVPGQTAAAADGRHCGPGSGEQGGIGLPADHRGVVAVRLDNELEPSEIGRRPLRRTLQQFGERQYAGPDLGDPRVLRQ